MDTNRGASREHPRIFLNVSPDAKDDDPVTSLRNTIVLGVHHEVGWEQVFSSAIGQGVKTISKAVIYPVEGHAWGSQVSYDPAEGRLAIESSGKQSWHILHHEYWRSEVVNDSEILQVECMAVIGLKRVVSWTHARSTDD